MPKFVKLPLVTREGDTQEGSVRASSIVAVVEQDGSTFLEGRDGMYKTSLSVDEATALLEAAE